MSTPNKRKSLYFFGLFITGKPGLEHCVKKETWVDCNKIEQNKVIINKLIKLVNITTNDATNKKTKYN